MIEQISVLVLCRNRDIGSSLESDLAILGFKPVLGKYPAVDIDDIARILPAVILLELTVCDYDALAVCDLLLNKETLPSGIALVAIVSENTMGQIPLDYNFADIIKYPYDITEFGFRLRRVLHLHHQENAGDTISIGNLSISPSRYEVKVDGQPVVLSHKEYELFKYLITHPDRVFTREVLLSSIWGYQQVSGTRTVDVHIRRVRAKIGDIDHNYIKTVRSVGYSFSSDVA